MICKYFQINHVISYILHFLFLFANIIVILFSYIYIINIVLWILVAILIDYNDAGPFAILIVTLILYAIQLPSEISKIRSLLKDEIKTQVKAKMSLLKINSNSQQDIAVEVVQELESLGLATRDIVISLVWGLSILILVTVWIVSAWRLFDIVSGFGRLISSLLVPILAYSQEVQKIGTFSLIVKTTTK